MPSNEEVAKALYSTMIERAISRGLANPDIIPLAWEGQPEILREDWRAVARVARDMVNGDAE